MKPFKEIILVVAGTTKEFKLYCDRARGILGGKWVGTNQKMENAEGDKIFINANNKDKITGMQGLTKDTVVEAIIRGTAYNRDDIEDVMDVLKTHNIKVNDGG